MSNSLATDKDPILFCFAGPVASGKSTICREITKRLPNLKLSISTTSRPPRPRERDGIDYYFVSREEFLKRIDGKRFIEYAEVAGNYYGTELTTIESARAESEKERVDVLLDIDVQGVKNLKKLFPNAVVTIFVFPVSFSVLTKRLRERGSENEEQIKKRLQLARHEVAELSDEKLSDYFLVNAELEATIETAISIITAERSRLSRHRAKIANLA